MSKSATLEAANFIGSGTHIQIGRWKAEKADVFFKFLAKRLRAEDRRLRALERFVLSLDADPKGHLELERIRIQIEQARIRNRRKR